MPSTDSNREDPPDVEPAGYELNVAQGSSSDELRCESRRDDVQAFGEPIRRLGDELLHPIEGVADRPSPYGSQAAAACSNLDLLALEALVDQSHGGGE